MCERRSQVPFTIRQAKLQSKSKRTDTYNLKKQGETLVMTKFLLCYILVGLTNGFLFDMDLNLHARLEKGNQILVGSGGYTVVRSQNISVSFVVLQAITCEYVQIISHNDPSMILVVLQV